MHCLAVSGRTLCETILAKNILRNDFKGHSVIELHICVINLFRQTGYSQDYFEEKKLSLVVFYTSFLLEDSALYTYA